MLRIFARLLFVGGLCFTAGLFLAAAGLGHAQDAADPDSASPERLKLARLVVVDSGLARSFHGLVAQMEEDLQNRAAATRPEAAAELRATLGDLQPEFEQAANAMTDRAAALYAARLSRRELADCAVFFAGPSGKAYVAAQPALIGDLAGALAEWRQQTSIAMMTRVREKMREKGREF